MTKTQLKQYVQDKILEYAKNASQEINDDKFLTKEEKEVQQAEYKKQYNRVEKLFGYQGY